ncbi:hypothetical protein EXT47_10540 [Pseudoalteromonas sp. CO342X]|uniref:Uncharacterized protein n=1 Tax=Pseudoalteromonas maricaloris TaxID=184924 RepID=A0A8I2H7T1_9GAMM|nr:hypothetical protein [Pseudoalteromonas maricaloris]RZG15367.1 hypothetical protein EXT47_10540 [Pseudoalteromonas sp. CO342X]
MHCEGALESLQKALTHVTPHKKQKSMLVGIVLMIERLAGGEQLSKDSFPPEGDLPKGSGKFHAFKRIPIRAYCWRSKKHPNTYFISHYIYKDFDKLKDKDIQKVHRNWKSKEE